MSLFYSVTTVAGVGTQYIRPVLKHVSAHYATTKHLAICIHLHFSANIRTRRCCYLIINTLSQQCITIILIIMT